MIFAVKFCSGFVCIPMHLSLLKQLDPHDVPVNTEKNKTAYTVTVDYRKVPQESLRTTVPSQAGCSRRRTLRKDRQSHRMSQDLDTFVHCGILKEA